MKKRLRKVNFGFVALILALVYLVGYCVYYARQGSKENLLDAARFGTSYLKDLFYAQFSPIDPDEFLADGTGKKDGVKEAIAEIGRRYWAQDKKGFEEGIFSLYNDEAEASVDPETFAKQLEASLALPEKRENVQITIQSEYHLDDDNRGRVSGNGFVELEECYISCNFFTRDLPDTVILPDGSALTVERTIKKMEKEDVVAWRVSYVACYQMELKKSGEGWQIIGVSEVMGRCEANALNEENLEADIDRLKQYGK